MGEREIESDIRIYYEKVVAAYILSPSALGSVPLGATGWFMLAIA